GISVLPELILKRHSENVSVLPIDPPFTRTIILGVPSLASCSPATQKFIEYVKDFCASEA
ncbi:MAG: hypothetical protein RR214_02275, partial [Synergistaceae bacterium]